MMAERATDTSKIMRSGHTGLGTTRRVRIVAPSGSQRVRDVQAGAAFVPLVVAERTLGVLRLDGPIGRTPFAEHPDSLLAAFAREAALGVQRTELAQEASHADALRQADEMKSALMTSISHDLKTPLAGIKTAVSSLLDASVNWSPDDRAAFLDTIDSQADRLNRVISDILDLNRIESGVIAPARRAVQVASLLDEARERTALATDPRVVTVDAPAAIYAQADESLISQALVNLIENAGKYSSSGLPIHLAARSIGASVEIDVADEGPGIALQDLPHVFERFYRAQEGSRRVKGSGLGLAIVKGFVTLCGGTVRVESSPAGTHFIITLPAAEPAKASA
jgi:two-component system sensor histidine kinase KdpD